jgi:hypothetical protein
VNLGDWEALTSQAGDGIWSRDQVWSKRELPSKSVDENDAPPLWKFARLPCRWSQGRIATSARIMPGKGAEPRRRIRGRVAGLSRRA